jgi:hypothetical protein
MEMKAGTRLRSAACDTEVVIVRAPAETVALTCGGQPMRLVDDASDAVGEIDPSHASGTAIGKRYNHDASGLELLCTKAGQGSLAVAGELLPIKGAKPLPSSD